jgi:hypothetical protein
MSKTATKNKTDLKKKQKIYENLEMKVASKVIEFGITLADFFNKMQL